MERETQVSALVSRTTRDLLERHVRATGVKKGHLVEQALRHDLRALQELPADVLVHPKLVDTKYGFLAVEPVEGGSDARPAPTPLFLSTRAMRAAMNVSLKKAKERPL